MKTLALALLVLSGCSQNREQQTDQRRNLRRDVTAVQQVLLPDGKIAQLTTKTTTVERETSAEQQTEQSQIEAPKILADLGSVAQGALRAAATATVGPAGGAAVDWIWQTVAGVGAAGAAAVAGKKAVEAKRNARQRDELADGIESAKDHMDPDTWKKVRKTLNDNQSDDTVDAVTKRVG